jgi:hypothetical protein
LHHYKAVSFGESFPDSGASDIRNLKASFIFLFLLPCNAEFKLIVVALFGEIDNCLGLVA